ncbi:KATNAL2 family protein [Megaselia abdita]
MLSSNKEEECRSMTYRRRNILYLIEKYLEENGFRSIANILQKEAKLLQDYEICDNVDLDSIYLEYLSYYKIKFGKYPQVIKKIKDPVKVTISNISKKTPPPSKKEETPQEPSSPELTDALRIIPVSHEHGDGFVKGAVRFAAIEGTIDRCDLFFLPEWRDIAESIQSTIVKKTFNVGWNDVCGNSKAVKILRESVEIPFKHPDLFTDVLKPWKSLLLHGPPGTGKTLLARITCSESLGHATFFNVSSSMVTSKWRGESEKIIKVLFQMASHYNPSIIFFDEIEGLTSKRDRISDHEASKRFKNEFLQHLDGLEETKGIFVLASTNLPWEIDAAFLRRFERKVLVQLPNVDERVKLFEKFLNDLLVKDKERLHIIAEKCEGFTGDEIRIVCKELGMKKINMVYNSPSKSASISYDDLLNLVETVEPTGGAQIEKFIEWSKKYEK